jgi:protocatechuate 3,4-dioxygenase beta subunit
VHGVVTDEDGQPRSGHVRGLGKSIDTDEAGEFASALLTPSSLVYPVASAEGCADSDYHPVELAEADVTVRLKLSCAETANGLVVDAEGKPVEGANVFLDSLDHRENATTDATGQFRFHQPRGSYQLKVSHDRYRSFEQPLQLPVKDVTVVLDAGGSLSGRVVDGKGAGIPGAEVRAVPAVLDQLLGELEGGNTRTTTDAEGRFEVTGLLAGRMVVSATADSQGTVVSDVVVLQPGEHRQGLVLTLDERVEVQGFVRDAQRRPIPGASVKWDPLDEKSAFMSVMLDVVRGRVDTVMRFMPSPSVTDLEGHYTLRGLPLSKIKLSVTANGFGAVEQPAARGDTVDFVLEKEGGRIKGRVVDEAGHPLAQFSVDGASFTPDDGRFEVSCTGKEDTLFFKASGFSQLMVRVVLDGPVKDLGEVVMKKGLALHVEVHTPDGKPLEGAKVAAAQEVDGDSCTTKADGRCLIQPLLDVMTSVKAEKDGYTPTAATLEKGQVEQPLTLTLAPAGGRLTGEVFALPGRPAPSRSVFLAGAVSKSVMTDGDGHFTAEGLPEGPYCASIDSRGLKSLEWAVATQASPTPTPVQLGPVAAGGVVAGSRTLPGRLVLVRNGGGPLAIHDLINQSASMFCEHASNAVLVTVTTGDFRIEGVPAGRWAAYFVSFTQAEDTGNLEPVLIDLLPNETKSL